ncbi:rhodanese-like domain-containing protein [Maricaulaceae bacterium MS644]
MENWTPEEVAEALEKGEIILVDVREPAEFEQERIRGALLYPLSTFDPGGLPLGQGKKVVLSCKAGGRSAQAVNACMGAGLDVTAHLASGMEGWKAAGLSYFRINPATGRMEEAANA